MKRSRLDRKSGLKTGSGALKRSAIKPISQKRRARPADLAAVAAREAWFLATLADRVCACGCGQVGSMDGHHVVLKSHVRKLGGDVWDLRNRLSVFHDHHMAHHHGGEQQRLRLAVLRPENLVFARELLGERAEEYLAKHYRRSELDSSAGRE